jgi:hypothetical protein
MGFSDLFLSGCYLAVTSLLRHFQHCLYRIANKGNIELGKSAAGWTMNCGETNVGCPGVGTQELSLATRGCFIRLAMKGGFGRFGVSGLRSFQQAGREKWQGNLR